MAKNKENNDQETPEEELVDQIDNEDESGQEEVTPLSVAEDEINDLRDKLLRAVAETENVRRRSEKEKTDAANYAVTNFARDMLAIGDNLSRALEALPEEAELPDNIKVLVEGVKMTDRELNNIFERHGISKIEPKGEAFDHNHHQAMFEAETDDPNGTIIQVMQIGYKIKERLLRPAMVGVSKGGGDKSQGVDTKA
ncbi:MAG: nucleotide exchange factor GrpE [Kordiimonadaceae bacterium]|jgi:molecular chaperone GrpE|nr:nucleotide exchange factor GrpE [Kordiimonadaceae bacterium]MBT6035495.1 nucleotide exchange factor GrpE [Kordiimonadaceae bacterium]MBT6329196.1 nucleotide exchange factor GrpE [Kordiimonadaceae bacterium]MBT7583748.1 nucleotide exchange factor GrpE [Kordiimonadaceae bacterium]